MVCIVVVGGTGVLAQVWLYTCIVYICLFYDPRQIRTRGKSSEYGKKINWITWHVLMYFYCSHPPPLFTLTFYNLHLDLTRGCSQKNINFRSTQPPFTTYARAEPASVLMNDCESGRWVIRMNKNYVEPQQRVETHSYYMMIGASAWFCCVAKIARQIMIFDLV